MVALRRLLAAGRLLRKLGVAGVSLVNEVGFRDQVRRYSRSIHESRLFSKHQKAGHELRGNTEGRVGVQ